MRTYSEQQEERVVEELTAAITVHARCRLAISPVSLAQTIAFVYNEQPERLTKAQFVQDCVELVVRSAERQAAPISLADALKQLHRLGFTDNVKVVLLKRWQEGRL